MKEKITFKKFLTKVFKELNPGIHYEHSWHVDLMVDALKKCKSGKIKKLIINIPPRAMKSICASVAFPAWILGEDPTKRIIVVSYSKELANKHSIDCRNIMSSEWYQELYPKSKIKKGESRNNKFCTEQGGFRFATSICGTLTGEGGDIIIVDDPQNPVNIDSKKVRNNVKNWFDSVLSSRLNNMKKGVIIIVMQRLHEDDLCGYLLRRKKNNANSDIKHLKVELVAHDTYDVEFEGKCYTARQKNDILLPGKFIPSEVERMRCELGSYTFQSQYQQEPPEKDSGIIRSNWIREYELSQNIYQNNQGVYFSIDAAANIGQNPDYSVISIFVVKDNCYYLTDLFRKKIDYPDLKTELFNKIKKIEPTGGIIVEDKSSGSALIQDMIKESKFKIIKSSPTKNKINRLIEIMSKIESGRLFIPKFAPWTEEWKKEICNFPNSSNDDQVDSLTQFLSYIKDNDNKKIEQPRIRRV